MPSYCNYSCSGSLDDSSYDSDISGIGVVISYVATAGIAAGIVLIYYHLVHEPSNEPSKINPVDKLYLEWIRSWPKRLFKCCIPRGVKSHENHRLEAIFVKCILAMSNLQLITGYSVLVSGISQVQCGLTTLYWRFIMELAWLSCFTHLVCLTLLRDYLRKHPSERLWRLIAMGILVLFVASGLFCELKFQHDENGRPNSTDIAIPAICYLRMPPKKFSSDDGSWQVMISAMLIILGFISRAIRFHEALCVKVFGQSRSWLSLRARKILETRLKRSCKNGKSRGLRFSLRYCPLLAAFLTIRFLLHVWTSLLFEVAWLGLTFVWGAFQVLWTFYSVLSLPSWNDGEVESNNSHWTYGQVMAVVLLAAPLLSIVEYFSLDSGDHDGSTSSRQCNQSAQLAQPTSHTQSDLASVSIVDSGHGPESPDGNWDCRPGTLRVAFSFAFCFAFAEAVKFFNATAGVVPWIRGGPGMLLPLGGLSLFGVIFFSLLLETGMLKRRSRLLIILQVVNVVVFVTPWTWPIGPG